METFDERVQAFIKEMRAEYSAQTRTLLVAIITMSILVAVVAFGAASSSERWRIST